MDNYLHIIGWKKRNGKWDFKEIGIDLIILCGLVIGIINIYGLVV